MKIHDVFLCKHSHIHFFCVTSDVGLLRLLTVKKVTTLSKSYGICNPNLGLKCNVIIFQHWNIEVWGLSSYIEIKSFFDRIELEK